MQCKVHHVHFVWLSQDAYIMEGDADGKQQYEEGNTDGKESKNDEDGSDTEMGVEQHSSRVGHTISAALKSA